jgi:hypothetical protein
MHAPTERLSIDVVAPRGRAFRSPEIVAPPEGDFDASASGRLLKLRVSHPATYIPYTLKWVWK